MEQVAQRLQQLEATIQGLAAENQGLRQEVEQLRTGQATQGAPTGTDLLTLMEKMNDQLKLLGEHGRPQLVDTRGIGKPSVFKNEESKFVEWSR